MKIVPVISILLAFLVGCRTTRPAAAPPMTDERRQLNLASFDEVWQTIHDQHWDKTFNGVDWDAVRTELRPKVETAKTDAQARAAMTEMLGRLKQSHFGIIPAEAYEKMEDIPGRDKSAGTGGASGVHVRIVDGQALVTQVEPDSAGETAGVQPGWIYLGGNKISVAEVLKRMGKAHPGSNLLPVYQSIASEGLLNDGGVGATVAAKFKDGRNRTVNKTLTLQTPAGKASKTMNLPELFVTTDVREIAPNIGYIAFNIFLAPEIVSTAFKDMIKRFERADGLIIDLRGNLGGLGVMANGMAGYLIDQPNLKLGEMTQRQGTLKFVINPQQPNYKGPVAILVDERSLSTSEIMAGGLQDIGRARIFGTPTPGAALPSRIVKLPNGDGFQYAFANYVSAKGDVLEGRGVRPDEIVRPDRESLLAGKDAVIDAAVEWIASKKK